MKNFFDVIQDFIYQGGPVLFIIFIVAAVMLYFIFERFFYFHFEFRSDLKNSLDDWNSRAEKISWKARKIRQLELSRLSCLLSKNMDSIKTIISICPLLGLLGTVTGMISVFEVMAELGTGNARLMAGGISMATIPTMAGMISALIGLYFGNHLEYRLNKEKETMKELFVLR